MKFKIVHPGLLIGNACTTPLVDVFTTFSAARLMHGYLFNPLYPFSLHGVVPSYPNFTSLDSPFSEEEVKKALFALAKGKASGPDAFFPVLSGVPVS